MSRLFWAVMLATGLCLGGLSSAVAQRGDDAGLSSFRNDAELRVFLRGLVREGGTFSGAPPPPPPPPPAPPPPPGASTQGSVAESVAVTGTRIAAPDADGITNTQIAGVDEGGIVKLSGDNLVILRRGRLFTVSLAGGGMRPVASIDAFPPGVVSSGDWYDEMLLSGDRVIVIGYSYNRGGTEVNRFRLGADGSLSFEDSTHFRSADYYSSRNYASRLIGTTLIYYAPTYLEIDEDDPFQSLPAIRRWRPDEDGEWQRIVAAPRLFVPRHLRTARDANISVVHSVIRCDLASPQVDCTATSVFGSESRTFFVSRNAIYLWTADVWTDDAHNRPDALLYRIPFGADEVPQAVGVRGAPIDQFSFSPDPDRQALNVLVQADGDGDRMWRAEVSDGDLALLRLPMTAFGSGSREVPRDRYQPLPRPQGWLLHNRFVGDHLLYGWEDGEKVVVVPIARGAPVNIALPHGVSRLDIMGSDAIVVGANVRGLGFSTIALDADVRRADTFVLPAAREGEARSHAFFFRPDTPDGRSGLLGLPVTRQRSEGTRFLGNSAAIQFLTRADRRLADAGDLEARGVAMGNGDDACVASCVDWYGNARPIFWRGRVFALMGYEIVEGREQAGRISEAARIDFAPRADPVR